MRSIYAAVWQDSGPPAAGRVVIAASALTLDGAGRGRHASRRLPYSTIASVRLGRSPADRVGGRPTIVLELSDGEVIRVATPELGALHELEEALRREMQRDNTLVHDGAVLSG